MGEVIDRYSDDNATEAAFLIFLTFKRVQYVVTITHRAVIGPNALSSAPEMVATIVILPPPLHTHKHTCLSLTTAEIIAFVTRGTTVYTHANLLKAHLTKKMHAVKSPNLNPNPHKIVAMPT